jgi:hypothetical protein
MTGASSAGVDTSNQLYRENKASASGLDPEAVHSTGRGGIDTAHPDLEPSPLAS